jgi:hypothetical protein
MNIVLKQGTVMGTGTVMNATRMPQEPLVKGMVADGMNLHGIIRV